jgi:hypothetical protein
MKYFSPDRDRDQDRDHRKKVTGTGAGTGATENTFTGTMTGTIEKNSYRDQYGTGTKKTWSRTSLLKTLNVFYS